MRSDFFLTSETPEKGVTIIAHGSRAQRIIMKASDNQLLVLVQGDPTGKHLIDSLREGLEHGIFRPKMRVLVDMSEFVGIVDWSAVFAMGGMIPPDNSTTGCLSRIAYVVGDNALDALIKFAGVLFDRSNHRAFDNRADAVKWLLELNLE